MLGIVPFNFDGEAVRVHVDEHGEPWFVAADVCRVLDISNPSDALKRLDDDERTLVSTEGGGPGLNLVSEAGLFTLVLGSRKPEAKRFKRWVTHEVLPQIRKTGSYGADPLAALADPAQLRTILLGYTERVIALESTVETQRAELAVAAPKVDVFDRVIASGETVGFREAAKILRRSTGVTERELASTIIRRGWAQRLGKRLAPAHYGEEHGYVTSRLSEWTDIDGVTHAKPEFRVTPKGLARLAEILAPEVAA